MNIPENKLDELFENAKKYIDLFTWVGNKIKILELFKKHTPEVIKDKIINSEEYPKINEFVVPTPTFEKDNYVQNITPEDKSNISRKKEIPNNSELIAKENKERTSSNQINYNKTKENITSNSENDRANEKKIEKEIATKCNTNLYVSGQNRENPYISDKKDSTINEISNPKKDLHSEIEEAAVPKINVEDKVIFERPKPSTVEGAERKKIINQNLDSGFPENKPNIAGFSELLLHSQKKKKLFTKELQQKINLGHGFANVEIQMKILEKYVKNVI